MVSAGFRILLNSAFGAHLSLYGIAGRAPDNLSVGPLTARIAGAGIIGERFRLTTGHIIATRITFSVTLGTTPFDLITSFGGGAIAT